MLFLDPTERNPNSRIAQDVIERSIAVESFEAATGADLLISPLDKPSFTNLGNKLGEIALRKHLEAGALLVQRKSGQDIINFIKDHNNILVKMQAWTDKPWLLQIGTYACDQQDKLLIDNQRAGGSEGWSYWSYWGALHAWQTRGGYVDTIARDDQLWAWIERTLKQIENKDDAVAQPRKPSQQLVAAVSGTTKADYERAACLTALMTIEGISMGKAAAITDYVGGKLKDAILFLSDVKNLHLKKNPDWPKGIGYTAFANAARWLGLESGGMDAEQWHEIMCIAKENINNPKLVKLLGTKDREVQPIEYADLNTPY